MNGRTIPMKTTTIRSGALALFLVVAASAAAGPEGTSGGLEGPVGHIDIPEISLPGSGQTPFNTDDQFLSPEWGDFKGPLWGAGSAPPPPSENTVDTPGFNETVKALNISLIDGPWNPDPFDPRTWNSLSPTAPRVSGFAVGVVPAPSAGVLLIGAIAALGSRRRRA